MTLSHQSTCARDARPLLGGGDADADRWWIHGVVRADAQDPEDAPAHQRVAVGDLAALVSPCLLAGDAVDAERETAEAVRHNALLTAYASVCDVAPARFGAACASPDAAAAVIEADAARYVALLDRLAGCVEMGVRILRVADAPVDEEPAAAAGGSSYLRVLALARDARRRAVADRAAAATRLVERLAVRARDSVAFPQKRRETGPQRLIDLALLTPRGAAAEMRDVADSLAEDAAAAGLAIQITGPWPAYSFSTLDAPRAAA